MLWGILLFNLCGFQILTAYLEERSGDPLPYKLDGHIYNETALISIKIPAEQLTYFHRSIPFEKYNGQIEICGLHNLYVKRRMYTDTIEMLCIPNQRPMVLQKAENDFFKLMNDLRSSSQDKKSDSYADKCFSGDLFTQLAPLDFKNPFYPFNDILYNTLIIPVQSLFTDGHPPEKTA